MVDWILRQAHIADDAPLQDVAIKDAQIFSVGENLTLDAHNEWSLDGRVLLSGMVDIHTHLDKTYSTLENKSGTLHEAIDVWGRYKQTRTPDDVKTAARRALHSAVANGVTAMRSHLNATDQEDLAVIEALLTLRDETRDLIDLQFVALGNLGGGAVTNEAMVQALARGLDYIGGAPALAPDPRAAIDATVALAEHTGKPIDLHIDETADATMLTLEYLAEKTIAHGMQGQVTAGHCCSLAFADDVTAGRVMDKVATAQIHIVTLPSCNLVLMGRGLQPVPRGVTRAKELLARGVNVCAASDNVRDPFNPFGSYDLLQIANLNAHVAHMTGEAELYASLDMVTSNPARCFGQTQMGIHEGAIADLVVVDAQYILDVVLYPQQRLATFKGGKLVVRTSISQEWL